MERTNGMIQEGGTRDRPVWGRREAYRPRGGESGAVWPSILGEQHCGQNPEDSVCVPREPCADLRPSEGGQRQFVLSFCLMTFSVRMPIG